MWLLDEATGACDLWMANIGGDTLTAESPDWAVARSAAREHEPAAAGQRRRTRRHLRVRRRRSRGCPSRVRAFNRAAGVNGLLVAPLRLRAEDARLGHALQRAGLGVRAPLASRAARCDGAAGHAGAVLQPPRRSEPARGTAAGRARGAQPHRARHPRHAGAGLRRHPDAAAGGAAGRRVEPAGAGGAQPRDGGRPRAHASDRGAAVGGGAAAAVRSSADDVADRAAPHGRSRPAHRRRAGRAGDRRRCRRSTPASSARSSASRRRRSPTPSATRAPAASWCTPARVRGVGFRLSVADDGRGITGDRGTAGFGMTSMRERAERIGASLTFVTARGRAPKWSSPGSRRRSRFREPARWRPLTSRLPPPAPASIARPGAGRRRSFAAANRRRQHHQSGIGSRGGRRGHQRP